MVGSIVLYNACSKSEHNNPVNSLAVDRTFLTAPAAGQTDSIIITSDVVWKLTIPAANFWIYSDKDSGVAGRTVVHLTILTNAANINRLVILCLTV